MNTMYKRKSFQFCNEEYSRLNRKAEVLKARESSRFKHLSITRDLSEEMDSVKSADTKTEENPRSLLLLKWKQEKQLRKDQEMKSKRRPFYVGGCSQPASRCTPNKILQNMKSSFMDHTTSRNFNASKIVKSRLVDSKSSTLSSKIPSVSKQVDSKSASQLSKIPSISRQVSVTNETASKSNRKPVVKNDFTKNNGMKTNGSSLKTGNQASSVYGSVDKNGSLTVKNTFNGKNSNNSKPTGSSLKTVNQILAPSTKQKHLVPPKPQKIPTTRQGYVVPPKPQKIPSLKQVHSGPPKPQKEISNKAKDSTRKGYCFKKFITDARKQQTECKSALKETKSNEVKTKSEVQMLSEQNQLNMPEKSLNWDISIIKPKNSFAPDDFKFKPPALGNFSFDFEDPDEVLEQIKVKYMSRTSTPSKETESSGSKHTLESPCKESAKNSSQDAFSVVDVKHSSEIASPSLDVKHSSQIVIPTLDLKQSSEACPPTFDVKHSAKATTPILDVMHSTQHVSPAVDVKNPSQAASPVLDVMHSTRNVSPVVDEKNPSQTASPILHVQNSFSTVTPILNVKNPSQAASPVLNVMHSTRNVSPTVDAKNPSQTASPILDVQNSFSTLTPILNVKNSSQAAPLEVKDLSQNETHIIVNSPKSSFSKSKENYENLEIDNCESKPVNALNELSACSSDSPFNILDLSEMGDVFGEERETLQFQNEEINAAPKESECAGRKVELSYKRVSMLKNIPTLNAIAEADDCTNQSLVEPSKENQNTRRRSKRLSATCRQNADIKECIPEETTLQGLPISPRRSLRLQKKVGQTTPVLSPFQQPNSKHQTLLRRSMRLIDLNTPESDLNQPCSKSNLTADFKRLQLDDSENLNPSSLLTALEMSPVTSGLKSRKVSLLYSPEKIKQTRKSVRGDLMAFSPN